MKMSKIVLAVFFTAATLVSANSVFAGNDMDHMTGKDAKLMAAQIQDNVSTLREAAGALKTANPGLSQKLTDMANMNHGMLKHYEANGMIKDKSIMPDMNTTGNKATKLGTEADNININTP